MSSDATLPFLRPDGTPTFVDATNAQDAVNSGYKPGLQLHRPGTNEPTIVSARKRRRCLEGWL